MRKLLKLLSPVVGLALVAQLLFSGATVFATPEPPTQPDSTTCTQCQLIQNDIDAAYSDLSNVIADIAADMASLELILDDVSLAMGGTLLVDDLTGMTGAGELESGATCEDSSVSFSYYSQFMHDGTTYCFADDVQYYGFFDYVMTQDMDYLGGINQPDLLDMMTFLIDLLMDEDTDPDDIEDILDLIDLLLAELTDCEGTNCPVIECPDCESIAADLQTALDDLADLELEADLLDAELTDLEEQINDVYDQLDAWEQLRADLEAMIEDAGGMHGEDCDGFEPASGQAWGIAHNFGDVQWCFTSEGQIEDMIQNLDDYWQTHSSEHLPSEEELNQELDTLMNDYITKLDEYFDVLDQIDTLIDQIDQLATDLAECLAELQALQDLGYCLEQNIATMQAVLDDANGEVDTPYEPPEPPAEEPPADGDGFDDTGGHWAEDFINELQGADVISGDEGTNNYRPDDEIRRSEASKIVVLANGDVPAESFSDVFFDVIEGDWFWPYVITANTLEYFFGYEDGGFGPNNYILRGEAAAVVLRVAGFSVPESYDTYSFPDVEGYWFAPYSEKAYLCGIFQGRTVDGAQVFAGGATITRAEFAKIVDVAIYNDLDEATCGDVEPECPDCDAIWTELEAIAGELDALSSTLADLGAQMEALQTLQDEFKQMVEDAGGMTDADCDGFEVGPGQAWGVASNFGDVEWCFTSESQIQDMLTNLDEYWQNNSSQHLPSEQTLQDQINQAMDDYLAKLDEYLAKLGEYDDCLAELEALQADGYCLDA
jgi:predicted  nucleic acid-binding Zn-ribbon protein